MTDWHDLESRLRARLDPVGAAPLIASRGDRDLNPDFFIEPQSFRPAAVLAPIVKHESGWTLLLTERASHLNSHAGQIAFPGGRLEEGETPLQAALRETEEEIGLARDYVEPLGRFDPWETGTGFNIAPIVGFVRPGFRLTPDPGEVASVFEVPFEFLMNEAHHERREAEWQGRVRHYYAMAYKDREIWGATAGMIRALYERLYL